MTPLPALLRSLVGFGILAFAGFAADTATPDRSAGGNTPLHLAALRGDAERLEALLAAGADPNALNDHGATPLHYATPSERMVAALLAHGAKPDVVSQRGLTPLLGTVMRPNSFPVARRLIEAGANIDAQRPRLNGLLGNASVLALAIVGGDARTIDLLLERGADVNPPTGTTPLMAAAIQDNIPLAEKLLERGADINAARNLQGTALNTAFFAGNLKIARFLVERGADPTLATLRGHATPPIVLSAYHDSGDSTVTKLMVERGVDVNAANDVGETALSFAMKVGRDTELVRYLTSVGAKLPVTPREKPTPRRDVPRSGEQRASLVRSSAQRSVDLLQKSSTAFLENASVRDRARCVSCHQQALPAVAFGLARERGISIDEDAVGRLLTATFETRAAEVENARQMDEPTPGGGLTLGYDADGFHALGYASDDMMVSFSRYLLALQHSDGSWWERARRPPISDGAIVFTAWTLRAVQLYPPPGREAEVSHALQRARAWLKQEQVSSHNDRVFQLLGLAWAGEPAAEMASFAADLLREQRADGGWAQLPGLDSDAWATGSALVALHKAGVAPTHSGYQRGVDFLLSTQYDDGSWWVRSRTWPFQPHFDAKFPHGKDQWISAAGTAWATIALLFTLEPTVAPAELPTAQQLIAAYERNRATSAASSRDVFASAPIGHATTVDFGRDIEPVLERSCAGCHGGAKPKGGFTLQTREDLLQGGESGEPAIVPGHADASPLFLQASGQVEDLEMPPLRRRDKYPALSDAELDQLRQWIDAGAPWPAHRTVESPPAASPPLAGLSPLN